MLQLSVKWLDVAPGEAPESVVLPRAPGGVYYCPGGSFIGAAVSPVWGLHRAGQYVRVPLFKFTIENRAAGVFGLGVQAGASALAFLREAHPAEVPAELVLVLQKDCEKADGLLVGRFGVAVRVEKPGV